MPALYKIRDKRQFLVAALQALAGSAFVSFEGDLSGTRLMAVTGASTDGTVALKRGTLWPEQDFVVLPLTADTVNSIMAAVGGTVPRRILHVQVEKEGRMALGLYDNFSPEAMFLGPALSSDFLAGLREEGIITPWKVR